MLEEYPGMCTVTGARNLDCNRHPQLTAGLGKRRDILTPVGFIKVHSHEVTGVVRQQWVNTDDDLSGQMLVEHLVGQR